MMPNRILVDTDVMVDYLRNHEGAIQFLETDGRNLLVSVMTVAELFAGCREEERDALKELIASFEIVPLSPEMAVKAGSYRYEYGKSHGTGLIDALLAATAESLDVRLATGNQKHFPMLKNKFLPYKK